jgi:Zn-dependent M32 family carboxypeptidase
MVRLIAVLRMLSDFAKFPDVRDSAAFRKWLSKGFDLFEYVADMTATKVDDCLLDLFEYVVNTDEAWELFHDLVTTLVFHDGPIVVGEHPVSVARVDQIEKLAGIDPATIMAFVAAIVELIKLFRNRKEAE